VKRINLWTGIITLLIGLVWAISALKLGLINKGQIGPGLWPFIVGVSLSFLGLLLILSRKSKEEFSADLPKGERLLRLLIILVSFTIYIFLINFLGIFISNILFLFVLIRFWGEYSWIKVGLLSVSIAISLHLIFTVWLNMPLPTGLF